MPRVDLETLNASNETLKRLIKAHDEGDVETQLGILRGLIKREQADYQRKVRLLAELKTLKQEARGVKVPHERLARVVALYKYAADVRAIGKDEIDDRETYLTANRTLQEICMEFRASGPEGMTAFESLLDDASPNVRACAGFSLVAALPARVIPILEEIARPPNPTCAGFTAGWGLSKYRAELRERSTS